MEFTKQENEIGKKWESFNEPLVSIVCVSYNHEKYIEDAIKSFLFQVTSFPFEIVFYDDASTDKTQKIIKGKSFPPPNIIKLLLQKENHWLGKGINGTYTIAFPAGLIDENEDVNICLSRELKEETGFDIIKINEISPPNYSAESITDESVLIAFVDVEGEISNKFQEEHEEIEVFLCDIDMAKEMLWTHKNFSTKAWTLLYHYCKIGRIE